LYKAVAVGEKTVDAHKTGARNKKEYGRRMKYIYYNTT
jgi:hypothetical protein